MYIWRISKHADLFGRGGLVAPGRWHTSPKSIVYCSDEPHTAYCEILRHVMHPSLVPDDARLLKIECPRNVNIELVDVARLEPAWITDTIGWRICRPVGDEWLSSGRTALLKVPSAARMGAFNYLLNPAAHLAQEIEVVEVIGQPFPGCVTTAEN